MTIDEESQAILDRLERNDPTVLGDLFERFRDRLWRTIAFRLSEVLQRRFSVEDVLQEAWMDVSRRIDEYRKNPSVSIYVWVRFLTIQRLQMLQRMHLGAQARDVNQERTFDHDQSQSSISIAGFFVSRLTSPSQAAMRHELRRRLQEVLETMDPIDREVLTLRHFEELSNQEVAQILRISKDAASKRHLRALKRLKSILLESEGFESTSRE